MSAPKRYEPNSSTFVVMLCRDHGEYVLYSDYAALAAENERLRKAGYAMAVKINVHGIADQFTDSQKLVNDWSAAAKEGRDAK